MLTYCVPCFWYVVLLLLFDSRCYLISLMMFSLTHWFFKPVLLNFHIFVNISVISLIMIFGFIPLLWFPSSYVCKTCFVVKHVMGSFLENGVHRKKMCLLLLLGGVFCTGLLDFNGQVLSFLVGLSDCSRHY